MRIPRRSQGKTGSKRTIIWPRVAGIGKMSLPCPGGSPRPAAARGSPLGPGPQAPGLRRDPHPGPAPRDPPSHPGTTSGTDPRTRTPRPTPGPAPAAPCGRAMTQGPAPPKLSRGRAGARRYLRETPWAARRGPARSGPRALPPSSPPLRPFPGRGGREGGGAERNAPPGTRRHPRSRPERFGERTRPRREGPMGAWGSGAPPGGMTGTPRGARDPPVGMKPQSGDEPQCGAETSVWG